MATTAAPLSINELFGLDSEFNIFDPKFKRLPGEPAGIIAPVKPNLEEHLNNHYKSVTGKELVGDELPPPVPLAPETIQAGKTTLEKAIPAVKSAATTAYQTAETGAGYLNQAIRSHTKFLTDVGEGITAAGAGAVTSGAGMAKASSQILNDYMARFAREGPKALLPSKLTTPREVLQERGEIPPQPAAERSTTFYRDTFKKVESDASAWSYEPKTKVGQKTLDAVAVIPHLIKEVSDFVGRQSEKIGVDPDRARLVSFATELVLFSKLDKGVRRSASGIRSSIAEHNNLLKNVKTDADLLSEPIIKSAEKIAAAVDKDPKISNELDAARTRLTETAKTGTVPPAVEAAPTTSGLPRDQTALGFGKEGVSAAPNYDRLGERTVDGRIIGLQNGAVVKLVDGSEMQVNPIGTGFSAGDRTIMMADGSMLDTKLITSFTNSHTGGTIPIPVRDLTSVARPSAEVRISKARTTAEDLGVAEDIVRLTGEGKKFGAVADAIKDRLPADMPRIQQLNLVRDTERAFREGIAAERRAAPEVPVTGATSPSVTAPPSGAVAPERPGAVSDYLAQRRAAEQASIPTVSTPLPERTYPEVPVRRPAMAERLSIARNRPEDVAAATRPEAVPAPAPTESPVAAASLTRTRNEIARELYARSLDKNLTTGELNQTLAELKGYAREGLKPSGKTETGLKNLGFTDEQITDLAPRLKNVRAEQAPYYPVTREEAIPATSTSTSITGPETATPAISRSPAAESITSPTAPEIPVRGELDFPGMFKDMAGAISGGFRDMLWDQYQKGSVNNAARTPELSLQLAKALKEKGLDLTRERFDRMVNEVEGVRATATEQGLRGAEFRKPLEDYYNQTIRELESARRVETELAKPDIQLTQTPDGDIAYVKPTGEVIAKVADTPPQVELAASPPGTEVTLPPAPGIVDTTPFIEKPKRQRKVVKAKSEADPLPATEPQGPQLAAGITDDVHSFLLREGDSTTTAISRRMGLTYPEVAEATRLLKEQGRLEEVQAGRHTRYRGLDKPAAELPVTEPRPTLPSEVGLPPTAGETRYYSTNLNSLTDTMRGVTGTVTGTAAPERAALQVRRTGSSKPDAVFVDTTGMNVMTPLIDIEKQVARGRMSKETGDVMIANLRRQADISGEPLATAHIFNGEKLQATAVAMARAEGLDLYVKKGKNYELMPKDAVVAESKLNSTDITKPSGVTKAEVAALTDFKSGPIGPEVLKEILESSERGLDISDRLPADLVQPYKDLLESERQGINLSERRGFVDMLKDLNTVFGESGAVGPRGPGIFSRERRMAAQRLEADVRRIGDTFTNFFRHQMRPEDIPMFERYLQQIGNPEPPKGVGPQRMSFEPTVAGDNIVKHRMRSDGVAQGPPLWESEVSVIHNLRNIGQFTVRQAFENPIYLLERMGGKELNYAARSALRDFQAAKTALGKDLKNLQKYVGPTARENIGIYAYSKTPQGMKILDSMGIKEIPTLNPKELRVYNEMRAIYDDFFERINEVREATGHEPLMKVDDYFTFARTYSVMERLGVTPDIMRQAPAVVNAAFVKYSTTPFPHQRLRKGSTYSAELDAFRLLDTYSNSALRQVHVAPFVSKMNELLETNLPNPNQPGPMKLREQNWQLKEENANAYNMLRGWTDYIATGRSTSFKFPTKVENAISFISSNLAYSLLSGTVRSAAVQVSTMRNTLQSLGPIATIEGAMRSIADPVSGFERWNRAMEKSQVLSSRRYQDAFQGLDFSLQGLRPREVAGAIRRGRITELQSAIGSAGLKPLEWMDMAASNVSWNAAYDVAIKKMGMAEKQAIRFADDLVVKTQGSTMPNDVAAIQRSVAGKAITQFQTFLISDFNFLTREVLGMRDPRMTTQQKIMNVAQFVGTTMAFNVLFEDVMHIQSPFPTLIKDAKQAATEDSLGAAAWRLASGAAEVFPIIGASRYGKGIAGPLAEEWREFTRGMAGAPLAPDPLETGLKLAGVPGMQQISKFQRAQKRGENPYDSMMGWYSQERTIRARGRREGRSRD